MQRGNLRRDHFDWSAAGHRRMEGFEIGGFHDFGVDDGFDVAGVDAEFERGGVVADAGFDAGSAFAVEEWDFGEEFYAGEGGGGGLGGGERNLGESRHDKSCGQGGEFCF